MPEILHITPHLGGGVGRVLLNYFQAVQGGPNRHSAACLDGANAAAKARAESIGLNLFEHLGRDHDSLFAKVKAADLVVAHWWNHPLLSDLLWRGNWPAARVLLWSHVSGALPPQVITPYLAAFPDIFAAASPVTLGLPVFSGRAEPRRGNAPPQINGDSTIAAGNGLDSPITFPPRLLFSSAGVGHVAKVEPRPHQGFRVGYLGTVDYAKMHPDFIDMSLAAQLPPDAVFTVAGGPEHETLKREVDRRGLAGRFEILGPIDDIEGFLAELDVFGYPLNPEHYGTGEQALIEAQAAGVPPVVLGGGAEEYVVEDGLTGLVAQSPEDYGACLTRLYHQRDLRSRLAVQAGRRARERFGLERTVAAFQALYDELLGRPKAERPKAPAPPEGWTPWQVFLASQGPAAEFYLRPEDYAGPRLTQTAFAATRGSAQHYSAFFADDENLRRWGQTISRFKDNAPEGQCTAAD